MAEDWIVSAFEVFRCGSACCMSFVVQHGSLVYEFLNRNTCINWNFHSACSCVNSDRRLITDVEHKSMAGRCVVLQHHWWVVQVIITSLTWFCTVARSHPRAGKRIWGEICHLLHTTRCWIRKCQRLCALLPTLIPGWYITLLVKLCSWGILII